MKQPRTRIAQVIADRTLANGITPELSREIAAYLLSERRANDLESVIRDVQVDWAQAGYVEVLARSAHELTEAIRAEITEEVQTMFPAAKTITVTAIHDPNIIGGVRLSLADRQLDLSVQAKLNRFKQLTAAGKE